MKKPKTKYTFIDLFAGIGGIRTGFTDAGFECVFASEWDKECQITYLENYGEQPEGDITQIDEKTIPSHSVLTAGFPCQPFSISGKMKGFDDTRGTLFFEILRILNEKKPEVVFLENVKHLKNHNGGNTLKTMIKHLENMGYLVAWRVLNAHDFGSAQNRERIVIIGNKKNYFDFDKLKKKKKALIKDILDIEGKFEYLESSEYTLIKNPKLQNSGLIFAGYRNKSIRIAGVRPGTNHLSRVHKQPNRIYSSGGTHPTLPSQESAGRFWILHNGRVRKLTLNECYRLMGFPDDFKRTNTTARSYMQLGNSVYIPMIRELAKEIKNQFLK